MILNKKKNIWVPPKCGNLPKINYAKLLKKKELMPKKFWARLLFGPKIDFTAKDSLGREWQVATIQLDINMPERFDLVCINEKGEKERIVMVHSAILGSIERSLAVLLEHFNGAFPLWLASVQVAILPISDKIINYANKIAEELTEAGIRFELYEKNETIGKKIREAETQKFLT